MNTRQPSTLPEWAVDFNERLRDVEKGVSIAKGLAFDGWKMSEEARDAARETQKSVAESVARLERCFTGGASGTGVMNHAQLAEAIAKNTRGLNRLREHLKSKGERGRSVEDSSVWDIPRDDGSIVRGRGSWRVRLPGRVALLRFVLHLAVGGGIIEAIHRLFLSR